MAYCLVMSFCDSSHLLEEEASLMWTDIQIQQYVIWSHSNATFL